MAPDCDGFVVKAMSDLIEVNIVTLNTSTCVADGPEKTESHPWCVYRLTDLDLADRENRATSQSHETVCGTVFKNALLLACIRLFVMVAASGASCNFTE